MSKPATSPSTRLGAIEAGGSKFICGVGSARGELLAEARIPTTTPQETIAACLAYFKEQGPLDAIGIASFGPVDLKPESATYGFITSTPKPGWAQTDLAGPLQKAFNIPIGFDTDVNGAALGEQRWGAAQGLDSFIYMTIGTGIGGGGMIGGRLLHGALHPEMGHIRVPHDRTRDPFEGVCPFHGDCLEGLASGPALEARWGIKGQDLPPDHAAWDLEAHYLGLGLADIICTLSPQRIILGGGVMAQPGMIEKVRTEVLQSLNSYLQIDEILKQIDRYIVPPDLGDQAGLLGAVALAERSQSPI
jgi:fructokinase